MPYLELRAYTEADLPALYALDQVCFPPGIAYSRAELRSFLHHPSSFAVVAVDRRPLAHPLQADEAFSAQEVVRGFAIVRPVRRRLRHGEATHVTPVLHLLTIDVAPEARRRGVGALLMEWIVEKAHSLALHAIVLEVSVDNETAQRFYQRSGFSVAGLLPGYYNGVTDALELQRAISYPS